MRQGILNSLVDHKEVKIFKVQEMPEEIPEESREE
jgi:hypothetical protein